MDFKGRMRAWQSIALGPSGGITLRRVCGGGPGGVGAAGFGGDGAVSGGNVYIPLDRRLGRHLVGQAGTRASRRRSGRRRQGGPTRLGRRDDHRPEALAGREARDAGPLWHACPPARHVRRLVAGRSARPAYAARLAGLPRLDADEAAHRDETGVGASRGDRQEADRLGMGDACPERTRARTLLRHASPRGRLDGLFSRSRRVGRTAPVSEARRGGAAQPRRRPAAADRRAARRRGAPLPRPSVPLGRHVRVRRRLLRIHVPRLPGSRRHHPARRRTPVRRRREGRRGPRCAPATSCSSAARPARSTTWGCTWGTIG